MQDPISQVLQEDNAAAGKSKKRIIDSLRVRKPSGKSAGQLDVYLQKKSFSELCQNQFNPHDSIIVLLLKLRGLTNFLKVMRILKPVL